MSALNQISGNSFAGLTTINTDLTIEGNLDVNGSIEFSDITMGNALITGDLVVIGSILEQNTNNNLLSLNVTNGVLLNCTISNLKLTNATVDNILLTNLTCSNSNFTNCKITNLTSTNVINTNLTSSSAVLTNVINTNLTSSSAVLTNVINTNLTSSSAVLTNVINTNLTSTNSVITNATVTNTNTTNINFKDRKVLINGTGANLNPNNYTVGSLVITANNDITSSTKSGCYISNIDFNDTQVYSQVLNYNSTSKEITYKPYTYGAWISNTDQSISQTTASLITVNTSIEQAGITLSSNKLTVSQRGYYKISVRSHVTSSTGSGSICTIFLKKNGTNIDNSGSDVYVPGNNTENSNYFEIITLLEKNDYIEAYVYSLSSNLSLTYSGSTGTLPATPGIYITMYQVS
jgi:uncharacterized protein YjbI with pentapeptide repeats